MKIQESGELPKPIKTDSRICFSIAYFKSEEEAKLYDEYVKMMGKTYNGGWFDGMACGRDKSFDHVDPEHGQLYAVTE
jgi:hypothetical protein